MEKCMGGVLKNLGNIKDVVVRLQSVYKEDQTRQKEQVRRNDLFERFLEKLKLQHPSQPIDESFLDTAHSQTKRLLEVFTEQKSKTENPKLSAFANWINKKLQDDEDAKEYLPINHSDLYEKCKDGFLFCKVLSVCKTDEDETILGEKDIRKGPNLEEEQVVINLILALFRAMKLGCDITEISIEDIRNGDPSTMMDFIGQIMSIDLARAKDDVENLDNTD